MLTSMLPLYSNVFFFIYRKFIGNDDECTLLVQENCTAIFPSKKSHTKGSSNLTLKNFVDFKWDHRYYRGQLIALHINEKLIAYGFFKRKYIN